MIVLHETSAIRATQGGIVLTALSDEDVETPEAEGSVGFDSHAVLLASGAPNHTPRVVIARSDPGEELAGEWSGAIAEGDAEIEFPFGSGFLSDLQMDGSETMECPPGRYRVEVYRQGADEIVEMYGADPSSMSQAVGVEQWLILLRTKA